jgi:anaerobic ribonucleoside-triphosphate reductase activating protein
MLTVHATEISEIYGHGKRFVIWFSGCTLRCEGCSNAYLWEASSGTPRAVDEIMNMIASHDEICGVTFIGGEPLEQGTDLLELSDHILETGLDIVLFTGYELHELNELQRDITEKAVVIIFGRYVESQRDTFLLHRGSRNQSLVIKDEKLCPHYNIESRQLEIEITEDREKYLGFPEDFV